jgi:hypothetical protein
MASEATVRIFEILSVAGWFVAFRWVRSTRHPVYAGIFTAATLNVFFDWMTNSNWFFRLDFAPDFIPLFAMGGVKEPLALVFTWGLYLGLPMVLLLHHRRWLDEHLGTASYLWVFLLGGSLSPVFEIPMVRGLHLWHYSQSGGYLLAGVPWSNMLMSGVLAVTSYGAARLALRWATVPDRVGVAVGTTTAGREAVLGPTEAWWWSWALGLASVWVAFYVAFSLHIFWYAASQPWVDTPRPF